MYQGFDMKCEASGRTYSYYGCLDVQSALRFGPWWRDIGRKAAASFGTYNGVHMRMGDYMRRYDKEPAGDYFLKGMEEAGFSNQTLVYFATQVSPESKDALRYIENRRGFRPVTSSDIPVDVLAEFDAAFEMPAQKTLRDDLLLPIELIILSLASKFVGASWSNVSRMAQFLRDPRYFALLFPEQGDKMRVTCEAEAAAKGQLVFSAARAAECAECPRSGVSRDSGSCGGDCKWGVAPGEEGSGNARVCMMAA